MGDAGGSLLSMGDAGGSLLSSVDDTGGSLPSMEVEPSSDTAAAAQSPDLPPLSRQQIETLIYC